MIKFKSVGHFFASVYQKVVAVIPAIQKTEATVENVTAKVPVYGAIALPIEKLGYALLGEVSAVLNAGGTAAKAKLADAGMDSAVIAAVEELLASVPQVAAIASSL